MPLSTSAATSMLPSTSTRATSIPPSTSTTATSNSTTTSSTGVATVIPSETSEPPSKVTGVRVTSGVQNTSPTLTVEWQALPGGAVIYTVKYSTQPGEVNTPPEGALEVREISGTSTILTALERGTTYYIWVVGVSEGGEGPHSDRMSRSTPDSELESNRCICNTDKGLQVNISN